GKVVPGRDFALKATPAGITGSARNKFRDLWEPYPRHLRKLKTERFGARLHMKKIILIVLAVLVAAGLVAFMVYKQQSGYTKVLTAKIVKQDLATVVSGTGQIKPKTYVNLGATAMGRITHLYVKEGDHVKRGQLVATVENVAQEAQVAGQTAAISAGRTDIASYVAAEKTAEANVEHAQADLEQKKLDW